MRIRYWSSDGCSSDLPPRPRGLRSKPFDGEGLPTAPLAIIDDGVLTGWLLDSASARQLGERSTEHASRGVSGPPGAGATNLYMEARDLTPESLMAGIGQGLYVTELIGHGVNPGTGAYSRGVSASPIENGELGPAAAEYSIAGQVQGIDRKST